MLLYAFASECLDRMEEPAAREFVGKLIGERLTELAKHGTVQICTEEPAAIGRRGSAELGGSGMSTAELHSRPASARSFVATPGCGSGSGAISPSLTR